MRHWREQITVRKVLWLTAMSLVFCTGSVHGQPVAPYNPGSRPAYSPYLNLLRRDQPFGVGGAYLGGVRPELALRAGLQQVEQQQQTFTETQQANLEYAVNAAALPPTGHVSSFMSHSRFFLNKGGQGSSARFGAVALPAGAPGGAQAAPAAQAAASTYRR
jgi:hypothetical protein